MDRKISSKRLAIVLPSILVLIVAVVTQAAVFLPAPQKKLPFASPSDPVILTDGQQEYQLGLHLDLLEDPSRSLTIEDVISPNYADQFVQSTTAVPNFGYTQSHYCVRFTIK